MADKRDLRKKDIVAGVLLFLFGAGMFAVATTYPMTENYGGVRNVWYVSPALFPLIIATLLMAFALLLVGNGVRYLVRHPGAGGADADRWMRLYPFLFITATLIAYVYLYIPVVDFWIATLVYLYLFITHFFVRDTYSLARSGTLYVAMGGLLYVMGEATSLEDMGAQIWRDGLCTAYFVALVVHTFRLARRRPVNVRPVRTALTTVMISVTFIVVAFKFGVLIPMPREGLYCYYLDEAYFITKDYFESKTE
jgi:hypothetical protein